MELHFDPVSAADAETLLRLARAFHQEDGHSLTAMGEQAVMQIAAGDSAGFPRSGGYGSMARKPRVPGYVRTAAAATDPRLSLLAW